MKEYMSHCHIPSDLKQQVYEYYFNKYYGKLFNEEAILNELSQPLKEVYKQAHTPHHVL